MQLESPSILPTQPFQHEHLILLFRIVQIPKQIKPWREQTSRCELNSTSENVFDTIEKDKTLTY